LSVRVIWFQVTTVSLAAELPCPIELVYGQFNSVTMYCERSIYDGTIDGAVFRH